METGAAQVVHASCVGFDGAGVLILGASGSGKSALALELMAMGAGLVADDRVALRRAGDGLVAEAPPGLPPLIEARGIGLLRADRAGPVRLALAVDLDGAERERLPPRREIRLLGLPLPLVLGPVSGHFAAAIRQYILRGRED